MVQLGTALHGATKQPQHEKECAAQAEISTIARIVNAKLHKLGIHRVDELEPFVSFVALVNKILMMISISVRLP